MDFVDDAVGLAGAYGAAAVVADSNNEIKFDNFIYEIEQMKNKDKTFDVFRKKKKALDNCMINRDLYLVLYDFLVSIGVITSEINGFVIITMETKNTINEEYKKRRALKRKIKENKSKIPKEISDCYFIDSKNLSRFFREYRYDPTAQVKIFAPNNVAENNVAPIRGGSTKQNSDILNKRKTKRRKHQGIRMRKTRKGW
jgi:hypothetical protein